MATTLPLGSRVPPVDDRRSSQRRKIEQLVYVSFGPDNGGYLLDVGEGGVRCRVVGALIQGETCRPKFILPETATTIEADCLISWTSESKKVGGLKFVDLPEEMREHIRQWLGQAPLDGSIRHVVAPSKMGPIEFGPLSQVSPAVPGVPAVGNQAVAKVEPQSAARSIDIAAQSAVTGSAAEVLAGPQDVAPAGLIPTEFAVPDHSQSEAQSEERDILSLPARKTFTFSKGSAAAILGLVAASLVLVYHFGRFVGFQSEAARASTVIPSSPAVEPPAVSTPDPVLSDRVLDPSLSDIFLSPPAASEERAKVEATHLNGSGNQRTNISKITSTVRTTNSPSVRSMQPPHIGKGLDAVSTPASALPEIAPSNTGSIDSRAFSFGASGAVAPARPQARVGAFPAVFRAPVLKQRVEPVYSPVAKEAGVEGTVQVSATVGTDGIPRDLSVIRGDPRLSALALDAIRQWRYQPALSGAYPIEAPVTITVTFRIAK